MRILIVLLAALFNYASAQAQAFKYGHAAACDLASFGGGWACLRSLASGTCGAASAAYYNAVCDGVTDDAAAWNSWITASVAANPTKAKLYIPAGSRCVISNTAFYLTGGNCCDTTAAGIKDSVICGYNATLLNAVGDANQYFIGGQGYYQDTTHNALIQTANAGDTTVTVTDGNISRFTIGDWVAVDALSMQPTSYPPNLQFFDYRQISAINGNVVTLSAALTNNYRSTYPLFDSGTFPQGPAMLHKMQPQWNQTVIMQGVNLGSAVASTSLSARRISLADVSFAHSSVGAVTGPSASNSDTVVINGGALARPEVDKVVTNLVITNASANGFVTASSSVKNFTLQNVYFEADLAFPLLGTPTNATLDNVIFAGAPTNAIIVGSGYGQASSITLNKTRFSSAASVGSSIDASLVTYSSGTFSVALASATPFRNIAVPGSKMYFANGAFNHCSPDVYFTISDVRTDGSNFLVDTTAWNSGGSPIATPAALPTPCAGGPATKYFAWSVLSARQTASSPGDVTSLAAP